MKVASLISADPQITALIDKLEPVTAGPDAGAVNQQFIPAGTGPAVGRTGAAELEALLSTVFGLAAMVWGPHWNLGEEAYQALAHDTDAVLKKYGGEMELGPEIALLLTATVTLAPPIMIQRSINAHGKEPERPPEPAQPVSGGDGVRENDSAIDQQNAEDQA